MALWAVAFLGTTPIGGPIIGWIGQNIGPRWGMVVGGIATLFAGVWGWHALGTAVGEGVEDDDARRGCAGGRALRRLTPAVRR